MASLWKKLGGRKATLVAGMALVGGGLVMTAPPATAASLSQNFDNLATSGWTINNLSSPLGSTTWFQGGPTFAAQEGAANSWAGANFNNTTGDNTISDWLISPLVTNLSPSDVWSFYTRTSVGSTFPDRLEFRVSTNGSCSPGATNVSVGDFTTVLKVVNPTLAVGGYPEAWQQQMGNLTGVTAGSSGCFAFRYFVTNGGPTGVNSNIIGVDTFAYTPDTTPPDTQITTGPAEGSTGNPATTSFAFTSTEPGSTFTCSVDGGAYTACTSPKQVGPLAIGNHTFAVKATDPANNPDATPATRTFKVGDVVAPTVSIGKIKVNSAKHSAKVTFTGQDNTAGALTYLCKIDKKPYKACTSPKKFKKLKVGKHKVRVQAKDAAGNVSAEAVKKFKVKPA